MVVFVFHKNKVDISKCAWSLVCAPLFFLFSIRPLPSISCFKLSTGNFRSRYPLPVTGWSCSQNNSDTYLENEVKIFQRSRNIFLFTCWFCFTMRHKQIGRRCEHADSFQKIFSLSSFVYLVRYVHKTTTIR